MWAKNLTSSSLFEERIRRSLGRIFGRSDLPSVVSTLVSATTGHSGEGHQLLLLQQVGVKEHNTPASRAHCEQLMIVVLQ